MSDDVYPPGRLPGQHFSPTGKALAQKHTHLRSQESTRVHISYLSNGLISFLNEQLTAPNAAPNALLPPPRIPCPLLLLACSIPAENKVHMRWVRAISTSWKYVLFDSTSNVVRPWIRKAPLDRRLTVNVVIKLHEGAVRFSDERLEQLHRSNGCPGSFGSKYEAESIEQPYLESLCQAGA